MRPRTNPWMTQPMVQRAWIEEMQGANFVCNVSDRECNTPRSLATASPQCSALFWCEASGAVRSSSKIASLKHVLFHYETQNWQWKPLINPVWTDKYLFILPLSSNTKPMCLICHECVGVLKGYNVRRHHTEKHPTFRTNFPEGSQERAVNVQSLTASYNRKCTTMVRTCTSQQTARAASLRVSWMLAKKKRPFTDSETVKECMLAVVDEVLNDDKMKTSVTSALYCPPIYYAPFVLSGQTVLVCFDC